jgi:hypothetical protein
MIGVLGHLERVACCPHNSPMNLGLPLYTFKRVHCRAISIQYYVPIQNVVQLRWRPARQNQCSGNDKENIAE